MLSNLRAEGMATEDGPWFGNLSEFRSLCSSLVARRSEVRGFTRATIELLVGAASVTRISFDIKTCPAVLVWRRSDPWSTSSNFP